MRRALTLLVLSLAAAPTWHDALPRAPGRTLVRTLEVDGRRRSYRVHVPDRGASSARPLVLVLHGGRGTSAGMERESGFSVLADREGFLVAYPDGIARSWNDGRGIESTAAARLGVDDVRFIRVLLDTLAAAYRVDRGRVFATGISNGAIFSHLLALRLADRFAAIAPVAGGLAAPLANGFAPTRPVSILVLQGTDDPLVPYSGGPVTRDSRGAIVATDSALALWRRHDGTRDSGSIVVLPDRVRGDGCRVQVHSWTGGREGSAVELYRLEGAGHAWPGGSQYLPRRLIGSVCRDIDATEVIWEFFARQARP